MENEQTEQTQDIETESTEPQKRSRRKSARRALEDVCDRLESCINAPNQKPAKKIDALQKVADVRLKLLDYDASQANNTAITENETLRQEKETDTQRIATLEKELIDTKRKASERIVEIEPDGRVPELQKQVTSLQERYNELLTQVKGLNIEAKARIVINSAVNDFDASRPLISGLGMDVQTVYSVLQTPSESMQSALYVNPDGEFSPLYRAVLASRGCRIRHNPTPDFSGEEF